MPTTTPEQAAPQPGSKARFITDRELAPLLGVSVAFLQSDRRKEKRIPHVRLGDRVLYDLEEVIATIKATTIGGQHRRRARQRHAVEAT